MSDEVVLREVRGLLEAHRGRENPITSQELSERLGGLDTLDSTPNTRAVIREVMKRYSIPVVGCPDGYFVVQTHEEFEDAIGRLDARIDGIEDRKRILREAYEEGEIRVDQSDLGAYAGAEASDE